MMVVVGKDVWIDEIMIVGYDQFSLESGVEDFDIDLLNYVVLLEFILLEFILLGGVIVLLFVIFFQEFLVLFEFRYLFSDFVIVIRFVVDGYQFVVEEQLFVV